MTIRTYRKIKELQSLEERFEYLKLTGTVGQDTFGYDRWINQHFYKTREWRDVRHHVIVRDNGCDLGIPGCEITDKILIHHMNPITPKDLKDFSSVVLDPEFLICTSFTTHQAIHYGTKLYLPNKLVERKPGDTRLW